MVLVLHSRYSRPEDETSGDIGGVVVTQNVVLHITTYLLYTKPEFGILGHSSRPTGPPKEQKKKKVTILSGFGEM